MSSFIIGGFAKVGFDFKDPNKFGDRSTWYYPETSLEPTDTPLFFGFCLTLTINRSSCPRASCYKTVIYPFIVGICSEYIFFPTFIAFFLWKLRQFYRKRCMGYSILETTANYVNSPSNVSYVFYGTYVHIVLWYFVFTLCNYLT